MGPEAMRGCYVTGTDTGIGKSFASTVLLHALRLHGLRAAGMKPVASGCEATADGWRNEDALALQQASDPRPAYADVNPFALPNPLAPELAAADAGVAIELDPIMQAHARLGDRAQGVGVARRLRGRGGTGDLGCGLLARARGGRGGEQGQGGKGGKGVAHAVSGPGNAPRLPRDG